MKTLIHPIKLLFLSLFTLTATSLVAQELKGKPLDAFIAREKKQMSFKIINNFWQKSKAPDLPATAEYASMVEDLQLDTDFLSQFIKNPDRGMRLVIPYGEVYFEIDLAAFDILSGEFQVATVANDVLTPIEAPTGTHYRGVVAGITGSIAAFSFYENQIWGIFSIPGVGNFNLVKNTLMPTNDHNQYLLYNDADLLQVSETAGCGTDNLPSLERAATEARNSYNNCRDVEMYFLADYAMYLSAGSDVNQVVSVVTALFNVTATLYRNEGIYTSLKQLNVNTTSDVYQTLSNSSIAFLNQFGFQTQNALFGADLGHLVSTRYGNMGGVAWVNVFCASYHSATNSGSYAFSNLININSTIPTFPTYSWNAEVVTHEMGHNFGSPHTQSCSWPGGAIDACVAVEGSCATPSPAYPVGGGTIMSYCHLVPGVGINFSNGFGLLPGNVIRTGVNTASCISTYAPDTVLDQSNTVVTANRECTQNGVTTYWYDNNNANKADDKVALKLVKGTNDIGDLDDLGFEVKTATTPNYGNGAGTVVTLPSNPLVNANNVAMSRYWQVTPITQPGTSVEVRFPFSPTDIDDISGNIPSVTDFSDLLFYKFTAAVNPDPSTGFAGATTGNTTVLSYSSAAPSGTTWAHLSVGNTHYARLMVSSFSGGGGFGTTNTPLPVELLNFSAMPSGNKVVLNWGLETADEIKDFTIAHAEDGKNYSDFALLSARDDGKNNYYLTHEQPIQGNNYYRLSYTTVDGKQVIAGFAQVNLRGKNHISIYPNPAQATLYIDLGGYSSSDISIYDLQGRLILKQHKVSGLLQCDVSNFAAGTYLVQVVNGADVVNQKIIIQ